MSFRGPLWGYTLVPTALGLATLGAYAVQRVFPHSPEYVFLLSVIAVAWIAGRGPGLTAAILAPLTLDYLFLPPLYTLGYTAESWRTIFLFLLSATCAACLGSARTEIKRANSQIRLNETRFAQILAHLPDVAWTANRNGQIHYVSPKISESTGFTKAEFCTGGIRFLNDRIHPEDRRQLRRQFLNLFAKGRAFDVEFRFRRKDGSWAWLHNRAVGTYRQGAAVLADGVMNDISDRKAAEFELRSKTALLVAQLNATIDGTLVVDPQNRRILQNRCFDEIFKIPPELLASNDDQPVRSHVAGLMKDPAAFVARIDYLNGHPMETSRDELELKDGTFLDRYSSPVVDDAGKCYGRIWTFRDITRRKRNEDTLRQLSLAVEQSPAVVVITNPAGDITYVNRRFTECTGYRAEEVLGKNPRILSSGFLSPETYKDLWDTIMHGRTWRGEFRNKKKSGELYWEAATITPILSPAGEITHFLALKEDVTSRKLTEEKLEKARRSAEEASRSLRAKHLALEGERRILHALIDNVPDFMYIKDTQSRFIVANTHTARALGAKTAKELVGKTDADFLPSEMAKGFYEDEQTVLRSGQPLHNREETCLDGSGNRIQILTTKVPIRDNEGKITGIAGVGRNITARKKMEDALREAEQKYRGIFDNAIVGIFQSTPEGRFLSVNPAMASMFAYDSPEQMVSLITDIAHQFYADPKHREDFKSRIAAYGGVQNFECEVLRKDGTHLWLSMSVRGIFENGAILRYEGMCSDITEHKMLREQLLQAQKLESVGQLAAGIAHEINTPTQFVTDNLVFLQEAWTASANLVERYRSCIRDCDGVVSPAAAALLEQAEKEMDLEFISTEAPRAIDQGLEGVRRVAKIVKAMKEFSHPDSFEKVQFDLNKAIESTVTIARSEWKYVAEVVTDFDDSLPLIVGYPGEINQVILNLLVNAAHAIKEKAQKDQLGRITICTRGRGQFAEVTIADTGIGIPKAIQTRIYEPFFTTKDVGKGTGQGLALAHSVVVKKHRGRIWFDTQPEKGTKFFIDLPFEPEAAGKEK